MNRLSPDLQYFLDSRADAMNNGAADPCQTIYRLGGEGLFRAGVPKALGGGGGPFLEAMLSVADVAYHCLTSAFVLWGQRVFIEYLVQSENTWLQQNVLPELLTGARHGATGLSNAIKNLAGIEALQIQADLNHDSLVLNGSLPWISNVASGRFFAAAAAQGKDNAVHIVAFPWDAPGVVRSDDIALLGLRSSATARVELNTVLLERHWLIAENGAAFLSRVRGLFLLLQCGLSIGLIRRIFDEIKQMQARNAVIKKRSDRLYQAFTALEAAWRQLASADIAAQSSIQTLFRTRIALSDLALSAIQLELQAAGGRGFLQSGGTERRWREIAFIPVVTPSVTQLQNELAKQADVNPTLKSDYERTSCPVIHTQATA